MLTDLVRRSALEQAAALRRGDVSAEELSRAYLARIEALEPRYNAFAQLAPERAIASARQLDALRAKDKSARRSALWGLPTGMKDLHFTRGFYARMGSRAFRYLWSPLDDASSAAVRGAGMVLFGKLTTSELAMMPFIETDIHPPTRNPWDASRSAGGSSGGSAAAIAAGMLPIAVASDGAGSIRIPAAFCGLVGHKPTRGLVPNPFDRFDPLALSVIGPHARSVDDAAAMMDLLTGRQPGAGSFLAAVEREPARMRVRFTTHSEVAETGAREALVVERAARALEGMGHTVEAGGGFQGAVSEFLPLFQYLAARPPVFAESALQPVTRWLREGGRGVTAAFARARVADFRARVDRWFGDADLWLTPTVAGEPPTVGALAGLDPADFVARAAHHGAFTAVFNASGHPAATVPVRVEGRALPAGLQIVGRRGDDARVLAVARLLMASLGTLLAPLAPDAG